MEKIERQAGNPEKNPFFFSGSNFWGLKFSKIELILLVLAIALTNMLASEFNGETKMLFNAEQPISVFKFAGGMEGTCNNNTIKMEIPVGNGWPQANASFRPALDCTSFEELTFQLDTKGKISTPWGVTLYFDAKTAGGYLSVKPEANNIYRINFSGIPVSLRKLTKIMVFFKNPNEHYSVEIKNFCLYSPYNQFKGMTNLAAGGKVIFEQKPTYPHCSDSNDVTDLTDGKFTDNDNIKMSTVPGTVGWRMQSNIICTIDLGSSQNIGGLRYHVGAGLYGSYWPLAIYVLGSDDGKSFAYLDELLKNNRPHLPEYNTMWANRWLDSSTLNVKARFIRFIVKCDGMFHFVDEVEIFQGKAGTCKPVSALPQLSGGIDEVTALFAASGRITQDFALLETKAPVEINALRPKINADWKKFLTVENTIAPMNLAQKELLLINARLLQQSGFHGIVAWTCNQWEPVNIFTWPQKNTGIELYMLRNERRGRVLNLTNATNQSQVIKIEKSKNLPVTIYEAVCMDSKFNFMTCNMLRPISEIVIPGGATSQLWLEFDTTNATTALIKGTIHGIEIRIYVAKADMPAKFSTQFGLWDYINNLPSHYPGIDERNFPAICKIIEKYQINTIWGSHKIIPLVSDKNFSSEDKLIIPPNYVEFDKWQQRFAGVSALAICYLGVDGVFAGINYRKDPVRFRKRVSTWLDNWMAHMDNPDKIMLGFVDEAGTPEEKKTFNAWADALRSTSGNNGRFKLFFNPRMPVGENKTYLEADILSPAFSYAPVDFEYYRAIDKQRKNEKFGFYACSPNSREFDPYTYYALPFRCGMLFNNFYGYNIWDMVSAPTNLNEYGSNRMVYSPLYFDGDKIFASKQLEATYEARSDYEYFQLLRKLDPNDSLLTNIQSEIVKEISGEGIQYWAKPKKRDIAEQQHIRMWKQINKLTQDSVK